MLELWITGGLLVALVGGEAGPSTAQLVDRLQERYRAVQDLRGDFVQTSHIASIRRDEVSRGSMIMQRPGRMRWEYHEPDARTVVLDDDAVRIYSPADRQLQIAPIASGAVSPTALAFLLGTAVLRDFFGSERLAESDRGEIGLRLKPRADAGFEYLELWLDPETLELRESLVVDLFGNRTRVRFINVSENVGVAEEVFSITVPDGTEVIDLR